jgi:hypothetical protein
MDMKMNKITREMLTLYFRKSRLYSSKGKADPGNKLKIKLECL